MVDPVSLPELKAHLRLEQDETGEDDYLGTLLLAADGFCQGFLDRADTDPALTDKQQGVYNQAVLLLAGELYASRDATAEPPQAVLFLLRPMRRIAPAS